MHMHPPKNTSLLTVHLFASSTRNDVTPYESYSSPVGGAVARAFGGGGGSVGGSGGSGAGQNARKQLPVRTSTSSLLSDFVGNALPARLLRLFLISRMRMVVAPPPRIVCSARAHPHANTHVMGGDKAGCDECGPGMCVCGGSERTQV